MTEKRTASVITVAIATTVRKDRIRITVTIETPGADLILRKEMDKETVSRTSRRITTGTTENRGNNGNRNGVHTVNGNRRNTSGRNELQAIDEIVEENGVKVDAEVEGRIETIQIDQPYSDVSQSESELEDDEHVAKKQ